MLAEKTLDTLGLARTDQDVINQLAEEIRCQAAEGLERLDTARFLARSPWGRRQTERLFRDAYLTSPARYFRDHQTEIAEQLLRQGEDVLSASAKSGFASPGRLHDAVVQRRGFTPGQLRRRGEGVTITFGFFETQLGVVMLAATPRGLCALALCGQTPTPDSLAARVAELHQRFPRASFEEDATQIQAYADQLVAFLEARADSFRPQVDILEGTTFQREVWATLQTLKAGETLSYTELAARVGRPRAVRAVAQACAKNDLAIAIPCHRVVHQDGSLAGYRWGVEWKRRLLDLEAQLVGRA
jgi:AraC family transcriptional regulator of adaptative response/methylated-DNA-[protein]-cysteine methyltransferase